MDFGFDLFLPRNVLLNEGESESYWELQRQALWLAPSIRFTPRDWVIRPYVDLFARLWMHWVNLERDSDEGPEQSEDLESAATGMYGVGAGLTWKVKDAFSLALSGRYMRGGGIELPDVREIEVNDGDLVYSEQKSGGIRQWIFGVEVGGLL